MAPLPTHGGLFDLDLAVLDAFSVFFGGIGYVLVFGGLTFGGLANAELVIFRKLCEYVGILQLELVFNFAICTLFKSRGVITCEFQSCLATVESSPGHTLPSDIFERDLEVGIDSEFESRDTELVSTYSFVATVGCLLVLFRDGTRQ